MKRQNLIAQLINLSPVLEIISVSSLSKGIFLGFFAMRVPFTSSHAGRRLQTVDLLICPVHMALDAQHAMTIKY